MREKAPSEKMKMSKKKILAFSCWLQILPLSLSLFLLSLMHLSRQIEIHQEIIKTSTDWQYSPLSSPSSLRR